MLMRQYGTSSLNCYVYHSSSLVTDICQVKYSFCSTKVIKFIYKRKKPQAQTPKLAADKHY